MAGEPCLFITNNTNSFITHMHAVVCIEYRWELPKDINSWLD